MIKEPFLSARRRWRAADFSLLAGAIVMEQLSKKVAIARRRLATQKFLRAVPWCLFGTLLLAALLVAVDKFYPLGLKVWAWPAMGAAAGVVLAAALVWFRGQSEIDAAIEIDRRFQLKERVSSTYALSAADRDSAVGRALIGDAVRALERVEVAEGFRLSMSRAALLPILPAAIAFLVAVFLNPASDTATATTETTEKVQVKHAVEIAQKKAEERRKEARELDLKDLEEPLTKLEAGLKQLAKGDDDRRQAMVKMNDLNKELEQRREELRGNDRLKDQLEQMKNLGRGPADKLAGALKNGDLKQAAKELEALKDQLKNGKLDDEAKANLAKQLDQIEQKLQAMVDKHRKLEDELKSQIAEKRAAGQTKEANELEKQLAKLAKQAPQMKQLERMAQKMGQCAQCTKQGDGQGAAEAMAQMQSELAEMAQQLAEAELLDEALDQLAEAKDAMACKECDGMGCAACRGAGRFGNRPGNGLGRGQGEGDRPEEETRTGFYDTKVKQQIGRGAATVTDRVEGPNVKGRVEQEIQSQFEAVRGSDADPLADTKLPRGYRDHARTYFDNLREGEKPAE
jgi:septal ring factor EnvC (AmiA/AmiB activator)